MTLGKNILLRWSNGILSLRNFGSGGEEGRVNVEGPFKKSQMRITTVNKEARNFCLQKHLLFLARDNHDRDYQKVRLCSKKWPLIAK